jgi:hypothetical protein
LGWVLIWADDMTNGTLAEYFNSCLTSCDMPAAWKTTVMIPILKKNGIPSDAKDFRAVGLESCVLKLLTRIAHARFYDAAESNGIIQEEQNGFRPDHRTNDHVFTLKSIIDLTRSRNETLYVAYVDISNAFPSTSHSTLWLRLQEAGMTGVFFDWLRMLYGNMEYTIHRDGEWSAVFRSDTGVLIGDPSSPTLWNLFLSKLRLNKLPGDITIEGHTVNYIIHADDIKIVSTSAVALQLHLNAFVKWCADNFLKVNAMKTVVMMFGPLPTVAPEFKMGDTTLPLAMSHQYVGIAISSVHKNVFAPHYDNKADQATVCGLGVFGVERLV